MSSHTVFLIQFEINLHLWVFQKAEIARAACNFNFLKNSLVQINFKLNEKTVWFLYFNQDKRVVLHHNLGQETQGLLQYYDLK